MIKDITKNICKLNVLIGILAICYCNVDCNAQSKLATENPKTPQTVSENGFPITKTYFSIVHPIVTFSDSGRNFNFDSGYTVGFPTGINFLQSEKVAFSLEFVPFISAEDGTSKVSGLLFHPGVIYRNIAGFNFLTRLAYNTNGRYGITAVINRPIVKRDKVNYFLATPIPIRFGNELPTSVTFAFQFGILF
ncbi:hypothetical protein J0656_12930 [Muricauda ruestringensis]|uniref:Outer membrane protein beta-barrel domain-containing protein n=1 Tax=Flagellimonas aurea TaxID=2915619 RepID=A0ABS3G683_9FLAO|nr:MULTISPECIES: hypothetical protein [Allomuricauda]MBO0354921.1 hypothetical protein [Allomuricauda aurea]